MKKLQLAKANKLRLMIYGKPGSGKTTLCGTAGLDDRTMPVLHIDLGGNPEALAKMPKLPNVTVLQPDRLEDLNDVYDWLTADQPLDKHLAKKYDLTQQYKTVIFDGFTDMQRQSFDMIMGKTDAPFFTSYPRREFKEYYFVLQQTVHMIAKLRELDTIHIIVTALEHSKTLGDSTVSWTYASPMLDGEAKREVPGYALTVMRMRPVTAVDPSIVKRLGARYTIGSVFEDRYQYGKDQAGVNFDYLADPTITKILDSINS